MKRIFLLLIIIVISGSANSQQAFNGGYRNLGLGGGYMFAIESSALNTNPSLLGWQGYNYDQKLTFTPFDFGFSTYAPLVNNEVSNLFEAMSSGDLSSDFLTWSEMLLSYNPNYASYTTYDTTVTRQQRQNLKTAIQKENSFKLNKTIFAFTYNSPNNGTYSFRINTETSIRMKASEQFADLIAFGKTSSYFDTLVLIDGSHIANSEANYQNSVLNQIDFAFSNDTSTIKDLIGDSYFEYYSYRNYTVGWGNKIDYNKNKDIEVYLGANLNIIESLMFFKIQSRKDELIVAKFFRGTLDKYTNINKTPPYGNSGLGLSLSFSGTAVYKKNTMFSLGVNNFGFLNWTKRKKGIQNTAVYSAGRDNQEYINYPYGTSKTQDFNVQLDSANFNWFAVNEGKGEGQTTQFAPANIHIGVRHNFGTVFSIGGSMITPIFKNAPGSLSKTLLNLNYQLTFKKFTLFSGLNNVQKQLSIPFGFSIGSERSKYEIGISTADILGYFTHNPHYSFGVGVKYRIM